MISDARRFFCVRTCGLQMTDGGILFKSASMGSKHPWLIRLDASKELNALWGVSNNFGVVRRGWFTGRGSSSYTSIAAPPMAPVFKASIRAFVSINPPRDVLIKRACGCIFRNASVENRCLFSGEFGAWMETKSLDSRSESKESHSMCEASSTSVAGA